MWSDVLRKLGSLVTAPAGPTVRADGRVWHLSPEGHALFGAAGPALAQWLANDSAMLQDRTRLDKICCAPELPIQLQGSPKPVPIQI